MASYRAVVDNSGFEVLGSGDQIDCGGWTLPAASGTPGYILMVDASGDAYWGYPPQARFLESETLKVTNGSYNTALSSQEKITNSWLVEPRLWMELGRRCGLSRI